MRAAIVREAGTRFEMSDVEISQPVADEILVRILGVGICHSDIAAAEQQLPFPVPAILGHEGAGIIEAVGPDVRQLAPGDHVVLTFNSCGACRYCARGEPAYCAQFGPLNLGGARNDGSHAVHDGVGRPIANNFFGQSSFGEFAIAHERNAVKVPADVPLELLGTLGCGVQAGAGAVMRSMAVAAGSSLLVLGAGTVGLAAVMAGVVQGCSQILVSEPHAARRALAVELGATHSIDPLSGNFAGKLREILPDGVDFAFDTTARADVIADALSCLASRGTLGLVGVPTDPGTAFKANLLDLTGRGLTVRGICEGDSDPQSFIPQLVELYRRGRLPLDRIVARYPLENINEAVADQLSGVCVKPVLLPKGSI